MQVAFYLAGEITQVKESIPWVRCASGNVWMLFHVFGKPEQKCWSLTSFGPQCLAKKSCGIGLLQRPPVTQSGESEAKSQQWKIISKRNCKTRKCKKWGDVVMQKLLPIDGNIFSDFFLLDYKFQRKMVIPPYITRHHQIQSEEGQAKYN